MIKKLAINYTNGTNFLYVNSCEFVLIRYRLLTVDYSVLMKNLVS
jgi:hypothetical protein